MLVVGLPVSLWERDILRRIGEECGGFLAVDSQTEKMEELQWAWLLVKRNGDELPNVVEVWVEELCYSLTLWWEVKPVMRAATAGKRGKNVATGGEVGGEACTRAGERVLEAKDGSRLEALLLPADGTRGQSSGLGQVMDPIRSFDGSLGGSQGSGGLTLLGLTEPPWSSKESEPIGLDPFSDLPCKNGPSLFGLSSRKISRRAKTLEPPVMPRLDNRGPPMPLAVVRAQLGEARPSMVISQSLMGGPDAGISPFWVKDGLRRPSEEEIQSEGRSKTDRALLEEDARYENVPISIGPVVSGSLFSSSPIYGRTPLGEYYDFYGAGLDLTQGVTPRLCNVTRSTEQEIVKRWELIEVNTDSIEESREELCLARSMRQGGRGWEEASWEESDLARFSKFLGFSTEGLEKDILEFLVKIRKKRERVHSKTLLEKSRFERELKRLECSINYEGGKKKKCAVQGRGC